MIHKLFFENISGLLRIFTNKNINFKLTIISQDGRNKIKYHFIKNILSFPNNIKQILTEFSFLKKNLDYPFFNNKNLNFILQISDDNVVFEESITIHYNDIVNLQSKNEKYNSKKKNNDMNYNNDEDINELLEFFINKDDENKDEFIFELE